MITDKKISASDYTGNDITGLVDRPSEAGMSALQLKQRFDGLFKNILVPKWNAFIDVLASVYGASNIGYSQTAKSPYDNVQDAVANAYNYTDNQIAQAQIPGVLPKAENISVLDAGGYYTGTQVEQVLAEIATGKSPTGHTHDDRYYTEAELNAGQLDNRYYTETEVNTELAKKPDKPSLLSAVTTWSDTDLILIEDGTSPKKMTVAYLKALMSEQLALNIGGRNLLKNSDFEDGWSQWTKNIGTETIQDGSIYLTLEGKNILLVVPANTTSGGIYQIISGLRVGVKYTFSAMVWVQQGTLQINANVGSVVEDTTAGWHRVEVTFVATSTSHTLYFLAKNGSPIDSIFYIDNVKFEEGSRATVWQPQVESGSNANGSYIRYPDGTMICSHTLVTSGTANTTWTFPVAFNSLVSVNITAESASLQLLSGQIYSRSATGCVMNVINVSQARVGAVVHLTAHGRWKA